MADSDENEPRIEEMNTANISGLGVEGCLRKTFLIAQCNYHQVIAHGKRQFDQNLTHCHSELKSPLFVINLLAHELKAEQKSSRWWGTRGIALYTKKSETPSLSELTERVVLRCEVATGYVKILLWRKPVR